MQTEDMAYLRTGNEDAGLWVDTLQATFKTDASHMGTGCAWIASPRYMGEPRA